jgi:hypothetical protein
MEEPNSYRTQSRESEPSGLDRVRQTARQDKEVRFTALLHHVNIDLLRSSYYSLKRRAAAGVDGRSANTGLCGGCRVTGIPTATQRPLAGALRHGL